MSYLQKKKLTESGLITSKPCGFANYMIGKDGTNDITEFTIYDGPDNTYEELFPTEWKIKASDEYPSGIWSLGQDKVDANKGLYAEWTCAGSSEIFFYFIEKEV